VTGQLPEAHHVAQRNPPGRVNEQRSRSASLKYREPIYRTAFPTRESAHRAIAKYIEVFYDRIRLHSELGYRTPHEVSTEYYKKQFIAAYRGLSRLIAAYRGLSRLIAA
jgi:transposase InsO family protein